MYQRITTSILLLVLFIFSNGEGYVGTKDFWPHILYPFFHANIFHLLGNLLALWMMKCKPYLLISLAIAILCSFIPSFVTEPTMGFSGVLFAMVGISWGLIGRFKDMCKKCGPILLITLLVPHMNAYIHAYCLLFGYLYGTLRIDDFIRDPYKMPKLFKL